MVENTEIDCIIQELEDIKYNIKLIFKRLGNGINSQYSNDLFKGKYAQSLIFKRIWMVFINIWNMSKIKPKSRACCQKPLKTKRVQKK